ncbi:hypothetical protein BDV96DRAFT_600251 [Lophiotrema nucula]|uniref:F-box domain-containing protein n=1 Tax=Lophiotrema nucula TaxID=690887 RepID=A0A6A5Z9Q9_9PLEO|nr:hypothetical protein BDV96DRAFT_600251 [Lophiotrema nucula]
MARTMSPEEYQELGRRYYKQKQYDKAVEAFTNGIEFASESATATTSTVVALYDCRAACFEKIGEFGKAVRDGRGMIRVDRGCVKGYLRTGSVLEKMEKLDAAIGIYKYGMKNVSVGDRNFKLLQQLHDKLTRKLSPPTAIDPFTILPVELAEMVISYLTFRNMVNCLRVSKGWKNYLIKRPNLWIDLDLSGARKDVRRAFVRDAVNRSEYQIRRATIHRFAHTDVLRNVATACKNLTQLEFLSGNVMHDSLIEIVQCATNLKKLVHHIDVTLDCISQVLRHRPTLEHAEFTSIMSPQMAPNWHGPFPKLHTLILKMPKMVERNVSLNPDALFPQTPALHTLKVINWVRVFGIAINFTSLPLKYLEIINVFLVHMPALPKTLLSFAMKPSWQWDITWDALKPSYLPHLTHLSIANFAGLGADFLDVMLNTKVDEHGNRQHMSNEEYDALSKLQSIAIRHCTFHHSIRHMFPQWLLSLPRILSRELQDLDVSTQECQDDDIEELVRLCTGLRNVNLSSTNITGASVKMLADGLPDLKVLNVDNCTRISSRDAIAYAEKKGIVVSWNQIQSSGGRRVRYG